MTGNKILLRSPNWLGDAVMTLPAVQAILDEVRKTPGQSLSVLAPGKLCAFWKHVDGIDQVLPASENIIITADTVRPHGFDSAILFPNSLRTAMEAWIGGIPKRYGFTGHSRRWLMTDSWPRPANTHEWVHHRLHYLDLVTRLGFPEPTGPFQPLKRPALNPHPSPYVLVCPGAEYGPAKRWPVERYADCINRLCTERNIPCVLMGSAGDSQVSEALAKALTVPCTNLTGQSSLSEFMAYVAHATLVLCNDSGSMHLAAAFGTKAVAIFGSTEPRLTGPISDSVHVIRRHVACSPCFLRDCPIDFRCMQAVTSDEVLQASLSLI